MDSPCAKLDDRVLPSKDSKGFECRPGLRNAPCFPYRQSALGASARVSSVGSGLGFDATSGDAVSCWGRE